MARDFKQTQKNVFWVISGAFLIAAIFFTYIVLHNQYLLLGSGKNQGCGMVYDTSNNTIFENGERVGYPIIDGRQTVPNFIFNGHSYNVTYCSDGFAVKGAILYYYQASDRAIADCLAGRSGPFADLQEAANDKCENIRHLADTRYVGKTINSPRLITELLLYWLLPEVVLLIIWKRYITK